MLPGMLAARAAAGGRANARRERGREVNHQITHELSTICPPTHHARRRGRPGRHTAANVTCARCQAVPGRRTAPAGSTPQRRRGSAACVGGSFRLRALRPPPQADRRRRARLRPGGSEARCRVRNRERNGAAQRRSAPRAQRITEWGPPLSGGSSDAPHGNAACGTARPAWRLAAVMTSARGVPPLHPLAALTCT